MELRSFLVTVAAIGFLPQSHAQSVIDNPYSHVTTASTVFTPDVMRDLGSPTRIRVLLTFQNDTWKVKSAQMEAGVYSSYPASTGFVRADLVGKEGHIISSIGVPDPRIVRIYQSVPPGAQWSPAPKSLGISHPVAKIPVVLSMQGHVSTLPAAKVSKGGAASASSAPAAAVAQPSASANPATSGTPVFHANAKQDKVEFAEQVARVAARPIVIGPFTPPPHLDAQLASGQVVLFLPNGGKACIVNVSIKPSGKAAIKLTTPLLDFEGHKHSCKAG